MKKYQSVLLVDDSPDDNFIHRYMLQKMDFAEHIYECRDGSEALDFLKREGKFADEPLAHGAPEIIFLDINMPRVNGWEFLEEYNKLPEKDRAEHIIIMLTNSLNPDDKRKAVSIPAVKGFLSKPLDAQKIEVAHEIIQS